MRPTKEQIKQAAEEHADLIEALSTDDLRALELALHAEFWRRFRENSEANAIREAEKDRAVLALHGLRVSEASICSWTKGGGWKSVLGHLGRGTTRHLVVRSEYQLLLLCSRRPADRLELGAPYRICARCDSKRRNWPLLVPRKYLDAKP